MWPVISELRGGLFLLEEPEGKKHAWVLGFALYGAHEDQLKHRYHWLRNSTLQQAVLSSAKG